MIFVYIVGISKISLPLYIYCCPYSIFNMDVFARIVDMPNKPYAFFVFTSTVTDKTYLDFTIGCYVIAKVNRSEMGS